MSLVILIAYSRTSHVLTRILQGGMLSLEEQIIDATTDEGQAALKQFEDQERAATAEREPVPDPE